MRNEAFFREIDQAETRVLTQWERWLKKNIAALPWRELERLSKTGGRKLRMPAGLHLDPQGLAKILANHGAEMVAAGRAHGDRLVLELHQRYRPRRMAELPRFQFDAGTDPRLIPAQAVEIMEARAMVLAGDVTIEMEAELKKSLLRYLYGTSRTETEQRIEEILEDTRDRASNITTTEGTYAYNRGRLASFADNEVDYVRFSAVMDGSTSRQCRSRHGKLMRLDDPRLANNTPPLHGRCRSVLNPVYGIYQPELLTSENLDWDQVVPLPKGWAA
ncbi:minor capsid protein [Desulforamulus ruminis]|uniref:Phage head morphogenesis protein, SPP1 gp7 family n=1 Tax=Desulforamulus ruminis (strain ATCC 23193 / DSM 2154 / NCIMB 8452 / DL) TaxID=696281 RepID=F6DTG3_DESRL|nr:minor capsid protein [Desulforamulus ruminis]AEG60025.1 phage head morphogenesis protein, SPP1 gp7 family [Desulforamulus ruminis DSM 2154]